MKQTKCTREKTESQKGITKTSSYDERRRCSRRGVAVRKRVEQKKHKKLARQYQLSSKRCTLGRTQTWVDFKHTLRIRFGRVAMENIAGMCFTMPRTIPNCARPAKAFQCELTASDEVGGLPCGECLPKSRVPRNTRTRRKGSSCCVWVME